MIVPMKKVSLIVLKNERRNALSVLRKAGVMHIEDLQGSGSDLAALKAEHAKAETALFALSELKTAKAKKANEVTLSDTEATAKIDEVNACIDERKKNEELLLKNERELERFALWGSVNPEDFALLKEKGIVLSLYEIPKANYYAIPEDVKTILVNEDKNLRRFIAYGSDTGHFDSMPADAVFVPLPEKSTNVLQKECEDARAKITCVNEELLSLAPCLGAIKQAEKRLSKAIEFENIYSGMESEETESSAALSWLTGFVPESDTASLKKTAAENNWAFMAEDPTDEDAVPTKLKNSKAVQMLYPVVDFLGTVPGYHEFDISAWFLVFLTIFFAMIFGDAGYGTLMLLISLGMVIKTKIAKKEVPPALSLLCMWALATVAWGTLNCSWFGIESTKLPTVLQNLALPVFAPANPERDMNLQIFCFILAVLQMSIGHIVALIRNVKEKSLKVLADIGSLSILWGMFYVVLMLIVSSERFPMNNIILVMIGCGFALSFVFSNYEGSIGKSILESLKNIISVLLGVINFFSDVVSYIRLWAVALAGSAIAETVNTMAGPMLGNFLIFFGVLLLVFGHGLNMVLNVLSVIVHGVRLNTLEFTSHVGMTWAGFKYAPFEE